MKYVIFDFGQVLVHFEPAYIVSRHVTDDADAALLERVVFDRAYWDCLDAGTMTDEQALAQMRTRLPERLCEVAERIYWSWVYNLPEMEGMRGVIDRIKDVYGLPVYLLSNISKYFAAHAHEIPILARVDRCFFSAVCGKTKPNEDFYQHLCRECGIDPADAIFVDDRADNVAAAERVGMKGYVFDGDADRLRTYLDTVFA